jgi:hypothetical protein
MSKTDNKAQYWRDRAKETRAIVAETRDLQARSILAEIADSYDRIAELVEARAPAAKKTEE